MASSSKTYSWESSDRAWLFKPPQTRDSAESEDETEPSPEEARGLLLMFLLELFYTHSLSARSLCVICYWAAKAGALGPAVNYGLKPDSPSGHFQRKVDVVTGINLQSASQTMYKVSVPQHNKYDLSRTSHEMVVQLPHECFVEEMTKNLHAAVGPLDSEWTKAYLEHPVVLRSPGKTVMPYAVLSGWHLFYKHGWSAGHVCLQLAHNEKASLLCPSQVQLLQLWLQGMVHVVSHLYSLEVVVRLSRPWHLADKVAFGRRLASNRFVRGCG